VDRKALKAHLRNKSCYHCIYCWQHRDGTSVCSNPECHQKQLPESLTCEYFDGGERDEETASMWTQHVVDVEDAPDKLHLQLSFQATVPSGLKKIDEVFGFINLDEIVKEKVEEIKSRAAKNRVSHKINLKFNTSEASEED
jgi:hypothetical protein